MDKFLKKITKQSIFLILCYLPFTGWIIGFILSRNNNELKRHAYQNYYLTVYLLILMAFISISEFFIPVGYDKTLFVTVFFYNTVITVYILLCIVSAVLAVRNGFLKIPLLNKKLDKIS